MKRNVILGLVITAVAVAAAVLAVKSNRQASLRQKSTLAQPEAGTELGQATAQDKNSITDAALAPEQARSGEVAAGEPNSGKSLSSSQSQTQTPASGNKRTPPPQPSQTQPSQPANQTPPSQTQMPAQQPAPPPTQTPPPAVPAPAPEPAPPAGPQTHNFSTEADESAATPSTFNVKVGDTVNLTIHVKTTGVYFGGIDFRGGSIQTGAIKTGESKTITFTANNSVTLRGYWPSNGQQKNVFITITAQ